MFGNHVNLICFDTQYIFTVANAWSERQRSGPLTALASHSLQQNKRINGVFCTEMNFWRKNKSGENFQWNMILNKEPKAPCNFSEGCQIHHTDQTNLTVINYHSSYFCQISKQNVNRCPTCKSKQIALAAIKRIQFESVKAFLNFNSTTLGISALCKVLYTIVHYAILFCSSKYSYHRMLFYYDRRSLCKCSPLLHETYT